MDDLVQYATLLTWKIRFHGKNKEKLMPLDYFDVILKLGLLRKRKSGNGTVFPMLLLQCYSGEKD